MIKRLQTRAGVLVGASVLALGAAPSIAAAASTQSAAQGPAVERVATRDADHIKSGNQATADNRDRVDAGSRNEQAKAKDRDSGKPAERTSKDTHADK